MSEDESKTDTPSLFNILFEGHEKAILVFTPRNKDSDYEGFITDALLSISRGETASRRKFGITIDPDTNVIRMEGKPNHILETLDDLKRRNNIGVKVLERIRSVK